MNTRGAKLLSPQASPPGMMLMLGALLVGCAGVPIKPGAVGEIPWSSRYRPSTPEQAPDATSSRRRTPPASPRILLASSDSPETSGHATGQSAQGYNVPGRNLDSQAPWEFFLGNAAHRLIAYMYGVNHPGNQAIYNSKSIFEILQTTGIGDPSRLPPQERNLRPDITDITTLYLFEIKPWNDRGLQEGRQELQLYLAALNRAMAPAASFMGGTDFDGSILIRFAQGQYIWRLEWQTTVPGVVQYRWTRSQQRFASAAAASEAAQWVNLTEQEMRQYGGWVGQAVEGMVTRREQLAAFSSALGVVIDVIGNGAVSFFSGAILGRMGTGSGAQRPPSHGGGQVLPFPTRPPPSAPPAQLPAAAMGQ
ncbi:hypothetical protein [Hyalangium gracile]|uniref:hypothetical protein n=1 Tax=Hyalangium gracile TaxID=394092 RepID=UPI001CCECBDC|nr:hypothetical protein [Hyalangium gracile]